MSNFDHAAIASAIKAAIKVELGTHADCFDVDEVPGTILGERAGGDYLQMHVAIQFARVDSDPSVRFSGEVTVPDRELSVWCHADSIANVRELRRRVGIALEDRAYLLPNGDTVGPFVFADGEPEEADDTGWFSRDRWTFV